MRSKRESSLVTQRRIAAPTTGGRRRIRIRILRVLDRVCRVVAWPASAIQVVVLARRGRSPAAGRLSCVRVDQELWQPRRVSRVIQIASSKCDTNSQFHTILRDPTPAVDVPEVAAEGASS
eukprot:989767-Rhodomonas_salina.2